MINSVYGVMKSVNLIGLLQATLFSFLFFFFERAHGIFAGRLCLTTNR